MSTDERTEQRPGSWRSVSGVVTAVTLVVLAVWGFIALSTPDGPEPAEPAVTYESVDWNPVLDADQPNLTMQQWDEAMANAETIDRHMAASYCGDDPDDLEFSHATAFRGTVATVFRHPEGATVLHGAFLGPDGERVRANAFCLTDLPPEFQWSNKEPLVVVPS